MLRWPRWIFYCLAALIFILDQGTKSWAILQLKPVRNISILPGIFDLTYVENTGVAFGMLAGKGILVTVLIMTLGVILLIFNKELSWKSWTPNLIGGLLVGGALSNLWDRARLGYVVDMLNFHLNGEFYWPVFNVADSAICIAAGWMICRQLFSGKAQK